MCHDNGFPLGGVEDGNQCYCGSALDPTIVLTDIGDCNQPCSFNHSQTCGAADVIGVFNVSCSGDPVPAPPASIMTQYLLTEAAAATGAVCLDGTPGRYCVISSGPGRLTGGAAPSHTTPPQLLSSRRHRVRRQQVVHSPPGRGLVHVRLRLRGALPHRHGLHPVGPTEHAANPRLLLVGPRLEPHDGELE